MFFRMKERSSMKSSRVDPALANSERHPVDGQHVSCDAHVHAMPVRISGNRVKTVDHDLFQALIDGLQVPEIALTILHPFKVRNRYTPCIGQNVRNNKNL